MNREKGWSPPRRLHDNLSQSPEGDFLDKYLHHPHVVVDSRGEDDDMVVYVAPIRSSEWREYEQRRKEWMDIATAGATRLCPIDTPLSLSPAAALAENTQRNPHEILTPATYEAHPLRGSASPTFRNTGGPQQMAATTPPSPLPDERVVGGAAEDEEEGEEIRRMAQQLRVVRARIAALKGAEPHPPPQQHEDEVQRLQEALLDHQLAVESGERQRRERIDSIQRSLSRGRPTASPEPRASLHNGALPAVVDRALRFDPASPPRIELVHGASDDRERRRVVNHSEAAKPSTSGSWSLVKHLGRVRVALPLLRQHATKAASAVEWSSLAFPLMMVDAELPERPSETGDLAVSSASSEVEVVVVVPSADNGSAQTTVWRCFVQGPLQQQHDAQDDGGHGICVTAPYAVWLTVELPGAPTAAAATSHSYQLAVATNDSYGTWRSQPAEITSFPLKGEGWLSVEVVAAGYRQWYRPSVEAAHSPRDAAVSPTARAQARRQRLTALLA